MKYLIVIVGPTAVGKTTLSIQLAKRFNTEIISADSRQLYKEMSIGTAVPSDADREQVRHHFIHSHSIFEKFTSSDYERDALNCLDEMYKENNVAVLCGGTGLYVNTLLNGMDDVPEGNEKIREQLIEEHKNFGIEKLQEQLQKLDPIYFESADIKNPQRVMRALEVCLHTGKPYSSFLSKKKAKRTFTVIKIGLELPREELYERINLRVNKMIEDGLEQEAKKLFDYKNLNALQTVGYNEFFDYFEGKTDYTTVVELIKQHSRNYAKRQLTWFKKDKEITWFLPHEMDRINLFIDQRRIETAE